ncbi:copper-binding protein [Alkalilimnicola ehrlichii MLHE-1]|uniref:Putative cation efflux system transmembrane protein n=1 Tax=Alkalilimnicola ehrlichii (strain ATCC BAA-1101 / DSM 17681 / MLHE-1) TaxID=187272 RepID=Q0A8U7_ALKEH|nr:copper-binding protein [Alkalilimnicola ehrlichii]ABI56740.1 putative cation efflux system transmembrane protein [Alkalilimnicola ehrlichii MLHE-1]
MNLKTNTYVLFLTFGLMLAAVPALAHDSHHGSSAVTAEGQGVLQAINTEARTVTLSHEPIPELRWPAMEMDLPLREAEMASGFHAGDAVRFTLEQVGETDYEIIELQPLD